MNNYKDFTKVEVASIVAIYHALNGERKYLHNIIADIAHDLNLSFEEKKEVSLIAIEEITSINKWSNDCLIAYYEKLLVSSTYVQYKINDKREIFLNGDDFYDVIHNEILRRMK